MAGAMGSSILKTRALEFLHICSKEAVEVPSSDDEPLLESYMRLGCYLGSISSRN